MPGPEENAIKKRCIEAIKAEKYCGVCLDISVEHSIVDTIEICIPVQEVTYLVQLQTLLDDIFYGEASNYISSNFLCKKCKETTLEAYIFKLQAKQTASLLEKIIQDLNAKTNDVNVLVGKNGKQFEHTIIHLQDEAFKSEINMKSKYLDPDLLTDLDFEEVELLNEVSFNRNLKYKCDLCKEMFSTKAKIASHIRKKHEGRRKRWQCCECTNSNCKHSKYLIAYKASRQGRKDYVECPECGIPCLNKKSLILHANQEHLKSEHFICETCGQTMESKLAYTMHINENHQELITCEYCDKKYKSNEYFRRHQVICKVEEKQYKCDCKDCPASFENKRKLTNHKKRHVMEYSCNLCNKVFISEATYRAHLKLHADPSAFKRTYSCSLCKKNFANILQKKIHLNNAHKENNSFYCKACDHEFDSLKEFDQHTNTSKHRLRAEPEKYKYQYKCKLCDFATGLEKKLESHVNGVHLKCSPFECNQCSRRFTGIFNLRSHIRLMHNEKKWECDQCGVQLSCAASLRKHLRRHTGERPYNCDICGEGFRAPDTRNRHVAMVHQERTIPCPLCGSMFATRACIRVHFKRAHWKSSEAFDVTKIPGLTEKDYEFFRDKRKLC